MVDLDPFGPSRVVGALFLASGLAACSPVVAVEGSHSTSAGTTSGATLPGATSGAGGGTTTQSPVQTLASGLDHNAAIAYSNQFIYHASGAWSFGAVNSKIVRIPLASGDPTTFLASVPSVSTSNSLAVNATDLYWAASDGTVRKAALDSAKVTVLFTGSCADDSNLGCPQSIALDDDSVYFGSLDGSVRRMPLNGGPPTVLVAGQSSFASVLSLRLDSSNLVWIQEADTPQETAFIKTMPLAGGEPKVLLSGPLALQDVAVYGDYAYATDVASGGAVYKLRVDQSEPKTTIATTNPWPTGVFADVTGVYWGGGIGITEPPSPVTMPEPIEHLADNTVASETIVQETVADSIISCEDAICWVDAATGDLLRYVESAP